MRASGSPGPDVTFVVVEVDVSGQIVISLLWAGLLVQIDFFVLDGTPQPLGEDVVPGASPAIHTDLDLGGLQPPSAVSVA